MEEKLFKKCSKCGIEKEVCSENFTKYKRSKDGYTAKCKVCSKKDYQENKEHILNRKKEYYQENKESILIKRKVYYLENKEKVASKNKKYYQENQEYLLEWQKQYYSDNKEDIEVYRKQYYKKNRKIILSRNKDYQKQYYLKNKNKYIINDNKRRARKLSLPNTLTKQEYQETLSHFNHSCPYCGISLSDETGHHMEHVMPISRDTEFGTVKRNIVPSCASCNLSKNANYLGEWYLQQDFYSFERLLKIYEITSEGEEWVIKATE